MSSAGTRSRRRPARVALAMAVGLALTSLAVPVLAGAATDARAREYAHKIINTWDRSPTALEEDTGGDGVVQRSEMRIRIACGTGQGVSRDAREFFDDIDGRGGPRDHQGQFREAVRFMKSFDLNHNGLSNGELGKAGLRYAARVEIVRC
jgi:hypothetical protein